MEVMEDSKFVDQGKKNWFVVQVFSSHEDKVRKQILEGRENVVDMTDLIEEVLVPTEKVAEVKAGKQKNKTKRNGQSLRKCTKHNKMSQMK